VKGQINGTVDVAFVVDTSGHVIGARARKCTVSTGQRSVEVLVSAGGLKRKEFHPIPHFFRRRGLGDQSQILNELSDGRAEGSSGLFAKEAQPAPQRRIGCGGGHLFGAPPVGQMVQRDLDHLDPGIVDPRDASGIEVNVGDWLGGH